MKEHLLKYLVCPECKTSLDLKSVDRMEGGEVLEGSLFCPQCNWAFPVLRGIPRIILGGDYALKEATRKNFAYSWKKFRHIYEDPRDFLDWIYPKDERFFQDKVVLDAGCGTGSHAVFASRFGAKEVIAFDLSNSVDVAFRASRLRNNVHIIQADIYNLPLTRDFDYIYSIGVLQHLPDTGKGFAKLNELLRSGGWCSIWVYGHEGTEMVRKYVDPIRRNVTTRIPLFLTFSLSFSLTSIFYFLSKAVYQPLAKSQGTKKSLKSLPMGSYISYMSQFKFFYMFNSVFDQLIAPITQYFRKEEVEGWFEKAGLVNSLVTSRNEMSWRGSGQKL